MTLYNYLLLNFPKISDGEDGAKEKEGLYKKELWGKRSAPLLMEHFASN